MTARQTREEIECRPGGPEGDPDTVTSQGTGEVLVEVFSTRLKPSASVLEPQRRPWREPPGEGAGESA